MKEITQLFETHGALILFLAVWLENLGLPIPSFPFLLVAGAMAITGRPSLGLAFTLATIAALSADTIWYYLGKFMGRRILRFICLISLNPESCVSKTELTFLRYGLRAPAGSQVCTWVKHHRSPFMRAVEYFYLKISRLRHYRLHRWSRSFHSRRFHFLATTGRFV